MIYGTISYTRDSNGTLSNAFQVRLGYEIISEDVSTNSRKIKLQLESRSINSSYKTYGFSQTTTIDGKVSGTTVIDYRNTNVWQIFGTREITIEGEFNGSKIASFTSTATGSGRPYKGTASVNIFLEPLHQSPDVGYNSIIENNEILVNSGIDGEIFVSKLSKKTFNLIADAYDNAQINEYRVKNGNKIYISQTSTVEIDFTINDLYYNLTSDQQYLADFEIGATDDQGGKTDVTLSGKTVIPYFIPNLIPTASNIKRNGQTSGKVTLSLNGTFYNQKIGNTDNDIEISFKYWKSNESEPTQYIIIPKDKYNISGNNITISNWNMENNGVELTDIDKNYPYKFKIMCVDNFNSTNEIQLSVPVGEYVWCEFKDRVDFKNATIDGKQVATLVDDGRNLITVSTSAISTISSSSNVPLNKTQLKMGSKLIPNDTDGVIIGDGVSRIMINFQVSGYSTKRQWYIVTKNGERTYIGAIGKSGADEYTTLSASPASLEVVEGDIIRIMSQSDGSVQLNNGTGAERTYLTIEDITPQLAVGGGSNSGGGSGTTNYEDLYNKPLINSSLLIGNKSFEELGANSLTNTEIEEVINSVVL